MARVRIAPSNGNGQVLEVDDRSIKFFPGYVVVEVLDSGVGDVDVYPSRTEMDFRYIETANVGNAATADGAALRAALQPTAKTKLSTLLAGPKPIMIPHRGAGAFAVPGLTPEAFRAGAAYGFGIMDGPDLRLLTDGTLIGYHNTELADYTTSKGSPYNLTGPAAAAVVVDSGRWFGNGFGNTRLIDGREFLQLYAGRIATCPEVKNEASPWPAGTQGAALAALIDELGAQAWVLPSSFSQADLPPLVAIGCEVILNVAGSASSVNAASLLAAGIKNVGIDASQNATATADALLAAGLRVFVFTITRQYEYATWKDHCTGIFSDDPLYCAGLTGKYRKTKVSYAKTGALGPGTIAFTGFLDANRGVIVGGPGAYRWQHNGPGDELTLLGEISPVANPAGTYTLTIPIVFENLGSDITRHMDFAFAFGDDRKYQNVGETYATGYLGLLRGNGQLNAYKVAGATTSLIGSSLATPALVTPALTATLPAGTPATSLSVAALANPVQAGHRFVLPNGQVAVASAAAAAGATAIPINSLTPTVTVPSGTVLGQEATVTVTVTPTTITVSRTDGTATTGTPIADSTYRGGYVHVGVAGRPTGLLGSFGEIAVS